ncbi:MAG: bifunctional nuclease family protein [Atopobiaceae bacterium]|nr:bifunctional nuclease family protein [Atopobiaceae bacterium]
MAIIRMDIQSVVVGAGPVASVVVLKPRKDRGAASKLPIRIGMVEAIAISMGVDGQEQKRPKTHDLLQSVISGLGAYLSSVVINNVEGTTFFAQLQLVNSLGETLSIDARPSDALALAVRAHAPIFAEEEVLDTAALPDFASVERDERQREAEAFHDFVEGLSPEDFA